MVSVEGRVSHPFGNMEFCPNYSPSFTIPPPDIFQASHFTGVTRQQGLFLLLPLDFCEDPGRVSTLTEAPARQSPGVPGGPAWPLAGCVSLSRPFLLLGLSFAIWKMKSLGRTISEVSTTDTYCLLSTVQKAVPWPQELNILPTV